VTPAGDPHVVLVTDRAFLPWCATAILSCVETATTPVTVHVVHADDVTAADRDLLRQVVEPAGGAVRFHVLDAGDLEQLPTKGAALGGRMSWGRIVLADVLAELDRVVYIDADTLVFDSVHRVWEFPMEGAPVAAVVNVTEAARRDHLRSLGFDDPREYFNAGVLLLDLAMWRAEGAGDALADVARANPSLSWFDQDALNIVFAQRWRPLDPRWNVMFSFWLWADVAGELLGADAVASATGDPGIVHFEGPPVCKPWHYLCPHPLRDTHRAALARTPWARTPLDDRTFGTRLIARLPTPWRLPAYSRLLAYRERLAQRSRPASYR